MVYDSANQDCLNYMVKSQLGRFDSAHINWL